MAATNHTEKFQLNQWEIDDPVLHDDFNEDNRKIEAALNTIPHIATGSYVGSGKYGSTNPNTLNFDFVPKMVAVVANEAQNMKAGTVFISGQTLNPGIGVSNYANSSLSLTVAWEGRSVSWHVASSSNQLNDSGVTYCYFAIG